jgi:hypothetical protein
MSQLTVMRREWPEQGVCQPADPQVTTERRETRKRGSPGPDPEGSGLSRVSGVRDRVSFVILDWRGGLRSSLGSCMLGVWQRPPPTSSPQSAWTASHLTLERPRLVPGLSRPSPLAAQGMAPWVTATLLTLRPETSTASSSSTRWSRLDPPLPPISTPPKGERDPLRGGSLRVLGMASEDKLCDPALARRTQSINLYLTSDNCSCTL